MSDRPDRQGQGSAPVHHLQRPDAAPLHDTAPDLGMPGVRPTTEVDQPRATVSPSLARDLAERLGLPIKDLIGGFLADAETRAEIIARINDRIDIPLIGEGIESRLIGTVYDLITGAADELLTDALD